MKTIRAILINPTLKTVELVTLKPTLKNIVSLLECQLIETTHYDDTNDVCYIDEEGLLTEGKDFFMIGNNPQPLAGNALIMGSIQGKDGVDDTNPHSSLEEIREMVTFLENGTFKKSEPDMYFMSMEELEKYGYL